MQRIFFPLLGVLVFLGCTSGPKEQATTSQREIPACQIATMKFKIRNSWKTIQINYNEGVPVEAVTVSGLKEGPIRYQYDPAGRFQGYKFDYGEARYIYNDSGRLLKVEGKESVMPRSFEYDEEGRITKRVLYYKGEPFMTYKYAYNAQNYPVEVKIYDDEGVHTETVTFVYDEHPNPLMNLGPWLNPIELVYGEPFSLVNQNVLERTSTYEVDRPELRIDGQSVVAGMTKTSRADYHYNEQGFPTEMFARGDTILYTYTCQ